MIVKRYSTPNIAAISKNTKLMITIISIRFSILMLTICFIESSLAREYCQCWFQVKWFFLFHALELKRVNLCSCLHTRNLIEICWKKTFLLHCCTIVFINRGNLQMIKIYSFSFMNKKRRFPINAHGLWKTNFVLSENLIDFSECWPESAPNQILKQSSR